MRRELVFLLEERSAKVMLESLLPRLLDGNIEVKLIAFEGKQDLEKQITKRIQGYLNLNARFMVLRDQDSEPDCKRLKDKLVGKCKSSGRGPHSLVRIACRELETFYLADLQAVENALDAPGISSKQQSKKFRRPDYLVSPSHELKVLTNKKYEKISGSREIGKYLNVDNERSDSFRNLIEGIRTLEQELLAL